MGNNNKTDWPEEGDGYLEISDKGFGFLRSSGNRFQSKPTDIFVTPDTIRRHYLREGCHIQGRLVPPHKGHSPQLKEIYTVNEMPFKEYTECSRFENLTTIDPLEKIQSRD